MEIQKVVETKNSYIVNDLTTVPKNEENSDYQRVKKWLDAGGKLTPQFTVEELKARKIEELNQKFSSKIYESYPAQKQINLTNKAIQKLVESNANATDEEYEQMNEFIAPLRTKKEQLEASIESCQSKEELEQICLEELENV